MARNLRRPREAETANTSKNQQPKRLRAISINKTIQDLVIFFLSTSMSLNMANKLNDIEIIKREFDTHNMTFNSKKLKEYITKAAKLIYAEISKEVLNDKLPSLMLYSASRERRHVYSVALRYTIEDEPVERTIGIVYQKSNQSARDITEQLDQLLAKVGLNLRNIYLISTDFGYNNLNAVSCGKSAVETLKICRSLVLEANSESAEDIEKLLKEEIDQERDDNLTIYEVEAEVDLEEEERLKFLQQQEIVEDANLADIADEEAGDLCSKLTCGAYLCDLAVKEVISQNYEEVLNNIRAVVTHSMRIHVRNPDEGISLFELCTNNKSSTFISTLKMINDIIKHRTRLEELAVKHEQLRISEDAWQFINDFIAVATPVEAAMKDFMRQNMTISEFYIRWLIMQIDISNVEEHEPMKTELLEALAKKKQKMFESDAFIAALILDPRINWSENPEDFYNPAMYERGMQHLEKIHEVVSSGRQLDPEEEEEADQLSGGGFRIGGNVSRPIRERINVFTKHEGRMRAAIQLNPLTYWKNKRYNEPEIYRVAQVVYGAAFSRFKISKDFNGFAFVMPILKVLLDDDQINAIFVGKNNLDLIEKVNFFKK